ncbi:hypothetical protein [Nocardia nova]|uniref:hypothetical protein n=1 Tax=Nocardia nova TaxID=37330 RepID=UPI0033D12FC1
MSDHLDDRHAAWELHVELATRISVASLPPDQGLLSEALSSLEHLSERTRRILRDHGPHGDIDGCRFQRLSRTVTDDIVGPLLAQWGPRLASVDEDAQLGSGPVERERAWPEQAVLRGELARMQERLVVIADELAELAGARSLIIGIEGV